MECLSLSHSSVAPPAPVWQPRCVHHPGWTTLAALGAMFAGCGARAVRGRVSARGSTIGCFLHIEHNPIMKPKLIPSSKAAAPFIAGLLMLVYLAEDVPP